jgi:1-deoxyxylulose-5-phosphate synthase
MPIAFNCGMAGTLVDTVGAMRYRQLGSSDLQVSEISLGSWLTYGGAIERERAQTCVDAAFEAGINFIDTANVYAAGAAEEFLGEALAARPRDSYVLATKLFWPMPDGGQGLSGEQVHAQLDKSLARLRTDYVDLYQCHRYDWETPLEETMDALTEVVKQGKARYIGFSEWPADKIEAAMRLPGVERFVSSQPQYSLVWRGPERDVIPYCAGHGISQIVWSPLAQGVLTGKYKPGEELPADSRAADPRSNRFLGKEELNDALLRRVQELGELAKELHLSTAQLALAWVLREEKVADNASASGIELDAATLARIDEIIGASVVYADPLS